MNPPTENPLFVVAIYGTYTTEDIEKIEDRLQHLLTAREFNGRINSVVTSNVCAIHSEAYYKKLFGKHWDILIKPRHHDLTTATTEKTDNNSRPGDEGKNPEHPEKQA